MPNSCKRRAQETVIEFEDLDGVFDPREYFEESQPMAIELGIGKGRFLRDWSLKYPKWGMMGVEIKKDRANRAGLKLEDMGMKGTYVVRSCAKKIFQIMHPEAMFDAIHLNFPDPWPKKRHAKNRMLGHSFLDLYIKNLKPGGALVFVTDDPDYALWGQTNLQERLELVDVFDGIRMDWPCYPVSIHEEKFRKWGRQIHYQRFLKKLDKNIPQKQSDESASV